MAYRMIHTDECRDAEMDMAYDSYCECSCRDYVCYGQHGCTEEYYVDLKKSHRRLCKGRCMNCIMQNVYEPMLKAHLETPLIFRITPQQSDTSDTVVFRTHSDTV